MAIAIAMSEPGILWNRLTAHPILFNVINRRIIYTRNALTANRTSRIGTEQLFLQRTGETARLQCLILKNRIKSIGPFLETPLHHQRTTCRTDDGLDEVSIGNHKIKICFPNLIKIAHNEILIF